MTLREAREAKGWTQTELAEESGSSQAMICRVEKGRQNLTLRTMRQLADALGVGPLDIDWEANS